MTLLDRLIGHLRRLADDLEAKEDAQQAKAIELAQQHTAVMLLRRESRERQRERDRGHLIVRGP